MTKFDDILKEAGFLKGLQNIGAGVGTALKTAQNPASVFGTIKGAYEKRQGELTKPLGKDNPPQKGQYIYWQENPNVVAKVIDVKNIDSFSVQLIHVSDELEQQIRSGKPVPIDILQKSEIAKKSDYLFVQTRKNQKWHIVTRQEAKELAELANQAQQQMQQQAQQQGKPVQNFTPIVIPENLNKFFVLYNDILEEKKGSKRTRKPRQQNATQTQQQPQTQNQQQQPQQQPQTQNQQQQPQQQPQTQNQQQPQQQNNIEKKDSLLVLNGKARFSEVENVGRITPFQNWIAIQTAKATKQPSQQNQNQQQTQPQQNQQQNQTQPQTQQSQPQQQNQQQSQSQQP